MRLARLPRMANAVESPSLARTVVLCLLGALCEGFDVQAAGVAAAGLRHELHPSPQALSFFFSASGAGLLIGALIGGRASDIVGRKLVLVASIVIVLTLHLMLNWLPLLLMGRGLSTSRAALAQAAFNVGGAVTGLWIGTLLDSRWKRVAITISVVALPAILVMTASRSSSMQSPAPATASRRAARPPARQ